MNRCIRFADLGCTGVFTPPTTPDKTGWVFDPLEGGVPTHDCFPTHDEPCVCGPYDRCRGVRTLDAMAAPTKNAAIRARHRAYND